MITDDVTNGSQVAAPSGDPSAISHQPSALSAPPRVKPGHKTSELWMLVVTFLVCALNGPLDLGIPHDAAVTMLLSALGYAGLRSGTKRKAMQLLCMAVAGAMLTGCSTALDGGNIVAVKTRTFGLCIGQSATTQSPEVKFGLVTTVVQLIPTRTNPIYAPRYFDTYDLRASWGGGADVIENTGAGDVVVTTNGQGSAIVPRSNPRRSVETNAPIWTVPDQPAWPPNELERPAQVQPWINLPFIQYTNTNPSLWTTNWNHYLGL